MTEFEEYKLLHNFLYDSPLKSWINENNFNNNFKTDWNVIMEVVDKIESIPHDENNKAYSVEIYPSDCLIDGILDSIVHITTIEANSKIEMVYRACVEFIKHYNNELERKSSRNS
jgi:hypothetical protein